MRLAVFWLAAMAAQAGVIQGVVLEQATGFALARTFLRLDPVPNPNGPAPRPLQVRTGRRGEFTFLNVAEGMYILTATRAEYAPTAFGQRRLGGFGTPIEVKADSNLFAELRMVRKGAISGRVLDENGVGIAGVTVIAYRARLPLRQEAHADSDDRGVYRIHGLDPGRYWIRTAAYTLDDGTGLLPTFGPGSRETANARIQDVKVDAEVQFADVTPEIGSLFSLGGSVSCAPEPDPPIIMLTVSSEAGRRSMPVICNGPGGYRMDGLAPGRYEVAGQVPDGSLSGFTELDLERNSDLGSIKVTPSPDVQFVVSRAGQGDARISVTLAGRRDDLSELDPPRAIKTPRDTLAAGHWDIQGIAGPGQYIESIGPPAAQQVRAGTEQPPSDSFRLLVNRGGMVVRVVVAEPTGAIAGSVTKDGAATPGAPVFLWPVRDETRRQLGGNRRILSNTDGTFRFDGLPPGDYRLLASFDVSEIDEEALVLTNAPAIHADVSQTAAADLVLWMAP